MTDPVIDPNPDAGPVEPPDQPPGWADVRVVLAVVLLPAVQSGFTHILWPQVVPRHPPIGYFETSSLAMFAGWVALVFYLIRHSGRPAATFGLTWPELIDLPWAAGLGLLVWWVGGRLVGLYDFDATVFPPPPATAGQLVLVVVGNLAVGFSEELVWRAYLLTRVEQLTGSTWQAVVLTSLLFGLAHLYQGIGGPLNAGAIGLLCGGAFVATRRIWPVALAHGGYDLLLATGTV